jgi:hypothetical protein
VVPPLIDVAAPRSIGNALSYRTNRTKVGRLEIRNLVKKFRVVTGNEPTAPTPPPGQVATRYEKVARPVTGSRGRQDFPLTLPEKRSFVGTLAIPRGKGTTCYVKVAAQA